MYFYLIYKIYYTIISAKKQNKNVEFVSNVLFQNYSFGFPLYTVEQNNIGGVRNKIEQNVLSIT